MHDGTPCGTVLTHTEYVGLIAIVIRHWHQGRENALKEKNVGL